MPGELDTDGSVGDYLRSIAGSAIPDKNNISGFKRLNYFTFFLQSGCFHIKHISVDVVFSASLEAAIAAVDFDELDAVRFIFRPKGLFRKGHIKGGGGLRSQARKSGVLRALQDKKYSSGTKTLWRFDTILQRILFWWMVWDIATNFVYNFSTLAIEQDGCEGGSAGVHATGDSILFTLGVFVGGAFQQIDYEGGGVGATTVAFNVISQGGYSSAGVNIVERTGKFPATFGLRGTFTGPRDNVQEVDIQQVGPGGAVGLVVNLGFEGPGVVVYELMAAGTGTVIEGDAFCVGREPS